MAITLGSGQPAVAAIINTDPLQLRFYQKFDKAYKIRYVYIARPPSINTLTQALYLPEKYHQGLLYKFIALVAEDMGAHQLSELWEIKYQRWLQRAKPQLSAQQRTQKKMKFSNFA